MISVDGISVGDELVHAIHANYCGFYLWANDDHCSCQRRVVEVIVTARNLEHVRWQITTDLCREGLLTLARRN